MSKTNPARGMRDFLSGDIRKREYVIGIIKAVYQSFGFEPLETPAVENIETLMGKYGEEGNQLIFKILKRGAHEQSGVADLALRYDLTVPFSRVVANNRGALPKFFKRYQIQPVWRADRPAKGRFREFYQCDVDAIGSKSIVLDAEILSAISEVLRRLGFADFMIRLNHRELLREMLDASGISDEYQTNALVSIDKLDKIGVEGVKIDLQQREITQESAERILNLFDVISRLNDNDEILKNITEFIGGETESIKDLRQILEISDNSHIKIDASLARGLSYYTGAIMEAEITGSDFRGSVGGGGRYDELIGMFCNEQIPACGFSLGLERLIVVMDERGMFPPELENNFTDCLVTIWKKETAGESLKVANVLRQKGLRVSVYPEADKLAKQFKYAASINAGYVCVIGENEIADGKVTFKNMQTGEQHSIPRNDIEKFFLINPEPLS